MARPTFASRPQCETPFAVIAHCVGRVCVRICLFQSIRTIVSARVRVAIRCVHVRARAPLHIGAFCARPNAWNACIYVAHQNVHASTFPVVQQTESRHSRCDFDVARLDGNMIFKSKLPDAKKQHMCVLHTNSHAQRETVSKR